MYRTWHGAVKYLPKRDQYSLGSRVENLIMNLLEFILLAQGKSGPGKILVLKKSDIKLQEIKLLVRLTYEIKSLPEPRYLEMEERVLEIGKMLGGWLKATQNPAADKTIRRE